MDRWMKETNIYLEKISSSSLGSRELDLVSLVGVDSGRSNKLTY